jgi:hypothetical protein
MSETKDQIAAERDELRAENDRLRALLDQATQAMADLKPAGPAAPAHRFQLSEGDRAELAIHGRANIGGKLRTRAEVRELLGDDQAHVDLGDQD